MTSTDEDRIAEAMSLSLIAAAEWCNWCALPGALAKERWRNARAALEAHLRAALARQPAGAFAGWFREIPSAMSYRLWEQGGPEQEPGFVALYEGPPNAGEPTT